MSGGEFPLLLKMGLTIRMYNIYIYYLYLPFIYFLTHLLYIILLFFNPLIFSNPCYIPFFNPNLYIYLLFLIIYFFLNLFHIHYILIIL